MSNYANEDIINESQMPHGAFAGTLGNGRTYDFENWRPRYPSKKINQYKGNGAPKRAAATRDFNTADAKLQVETQTGGVPDDLPATGTTFTWADGTVWWLESITLNEATGEAWTYDTTWQKFEN